MIDENGKWAPDLSPKGYQVLNDYRRFLLLHGPRKSSKTTNVIAKICRHLWENDNAMFAIVGKSIRTIKSSGIWQDLILLPTGIRQWLNSGIGFKYTIEPKLTGDTKMTYFRILNMFGGQSECQVHSLEHDHEVEQKFKGTRYSGFYLPEADLFKSESVLHALDDQLRVINIPYENHQILLDCNPPEEGDEHWLYRYFFQHIGEDGQEFKPEYACQFGQYHFGLEDNPYLDPREIEMLRNKYRHDKVKEARYVEGRWERDTGGGIFEDVWIENIHVLGDVQKPSEEEWEIIVPGPQSIELVTGWDTGDVNHSVGILCPRTEGVQTVFDLIDEVVVIDRQISLVDFTDAVVERLDFWENLLGQLYGHKTIRWRHWSDSSATRYRSSSDTYDYQIIRNASDGRINLTPVKKVSGSVKKRIDLVRKILFDERIKVSASCKHHIQMFRYLKPGGSRGEPIQRGSIHKHCFDDLSYALENEAPADLERRNQASVVRKPKIISV